MKKSKTVIKDKNTTSNKLESSELELLAADISGVSRVLDNTHDHSIDGDKAL